MSTTNGQAVPERVDIFDDTVIFGLPGGRGDIACSPPDMIEELDAIQDKLNAEGKTLYDYYRAVAQYIGERTPGVPLLSLGQAENFNHQLRLFWAKKKQSQRDAMRAALGLAASMESLLAD